MEGPRPGHLARPPFGTGVAFALVLGALAGSRLPALPLTALLAVLLGLGAFAWWRFDDWRRPAGALLAGFALFGLHAAWALSQQLPPDLERGDFAIDGRVVQLPEHEPRRTRFLFRVDRGQATPPALRGRLLRLSWYDDRAAADSQRHAIEAGSRWRFTARLRAPRGLRNPGWYDSEKHMLAGRIAATGYVRDAEPAERRHGGAGIDGWRERIAGRIDAAVARPASRFVRALALGDTRGLDDVDWEILRATGLTHLVAISGFHVGLVAGFAALAIAGLWWLLPALGRRVPRPQAAAAGALLGAAGYAAVAGFALPTVRTVLMVAVVVLARLWRRPMGVADSLALAAIALLLADPLSVLAAGFWLSFAGVAWLVWCLPRVGAQPVVRGFLAAQWVATLGLLPLTAVMFGQASLAGPLANLVAIPWWSLVVVPMALVGTGLEALHPGWGGGAWRLAASCFELSWPLFEWLAAGRAALWWLPEARWFALPLALLGAFWLLLPRAVPGKALALMLLLPLLWPDRELPRPGEVDLVMLDVGQGGALLVRTARHAFLYDAGPAVPEGFDAGERVVVPALHALGVRRLDATIVSHGDADHAGGFASLRRRLDTGPVFAARDAAIEDAVPCLAGSRWEADGVVFRFLHPDLHFPEMGNESSCVLRIESAHGSVLLAADVGEVVERLLVHDHPGGLRSDVVLVAHHGSAGSSDPAFIAATAPQVALVSAGHGNRFGHPKPEVMRRWVERGAAGAVTAREGAVLVRLRGSGLQLESRRRAQPRLWDAARRAETVH
ncbi:DNA internalization-related competence protein ComEC/Rec2 [Luteimonas viscosa]|uniref:DNA internalization-related competence protein ComEC/Rec2 n=1 Tax=Luteimonas viscosa TaxID=1132694 RepID=A0A5D4XJH5_9GAMM|nr:DNA internalization-related competence protein ComEC/Rec2 [Luteimonas viscosa]TYT24817.1 DNA internalization-related competence protein ComEC/Rec2 [Luteimonas viscosa]